MKGPGHCLPLRAVAPQRVIEVFCSFNVSAVASPGAWLAERLPTAAPATRRLTSARTPRSAENSPHGSCKLQRVGNLRTEAPPGPPPSGDIAGKWRQMPSASSPSAPATPVQTIRIKTGHRDTGAGTLTELDSGDLVENSDPKPAAEFRTERLRQQYCATSFIKEGRAWQRRSAILNGRQAAQSR